MSVIHLSQDNFQSLRRSGETLLVDFHAKWCGPCRMLSPILDEVAETGVTVVKIDVDESPELAREFGVYSIPALFVIKGGEVTNQAVGLRSKEELLAMLGG